MVAPEWQATPLPSAIIFLFLIDLMYCATTSITSKVVIEESLHKSLFCYYSKSNLINNYVLLFLQYVLF